jgi:hypothetical protein
VTQQEAVDKLNALDDWADAHLAADEILLEVLRANGMADVADAWTRVRSRFRDGFHYC